MRPSPSYFVHLLFQGINAGALVTTLPDMEARTSSNTAQMSTIFIWLGLANIIGVLVIGPLFDRVNSMLLMALCFILMAVCGSLAPTWPNLTTFQALAATAIAFYASLVSGKLYP